MITLLGIIALGLLGFAIWNSIPPERPEIIEARKKYGKISQEKLNKALGRRKPF